MVFRLARAALDHGEIAVQEFSLRISDCASTGARSFTSMCLVAVQAHVDEVRGDVMHHRVALGGFGDHQRDVVFTEEIDERRIAKALVPDLHGVAQRTARIDAQLGSTLHTRVTFACEPQGALCIVRQLISIVGRTRDA